MTPSNETITLTASKVRSLVDAAKMLAPNLADTTHGRAIAAVEAELNALPKKDQVTQIELTDEVRWILGQPCFACGEIGRMLGAKHKAEDEQAVAIHFMLNLYLKHGDEWRKEGAQTIGEYLEKLKTKTP